MRRAAQEQVAQARQDAERDQAGLEAQVAAAEEARAGLRAAPSRRRGGWPGREATAAAEQAARAAREQVAAAGQERDEAARGPESRAAGAESLAAEAQ